MAELFIKTGNTSYILVAILGVWAVVIVGWTILAVARIRVPAPLWWLLPATMLGVGGGATLYRFNLIDRALEVSGANDPLLELAGRAEGAYALWLAAWFTAGALGLSAPFLALANILRAGEFPKWKLLHALPAVLGVAAIAAGPLSGTAATVLGAVGTVSIAVAALRLGAGDDRRRMVAGRAFVGNLLVFSGLSLAIAHLVGSRIQVLEIWATAPFESRDALIREAEAAMPWVVGADLAVAGVLALGSVFTLFPVLRAVLDSRTSGGWLFSAFISVIPAALVAPAVMPLFTFKPVDEQSLRRTALKRAGIELVYADEGDDWTPGFPITVGTYWGHVNDERLLPYKDGRIAYELMDPTGTWPMPVVRLLEEAGSPSVRLEVDKRTDYQRVLPILVALREARVTSACFVVRDNSGEFNCLPFDLAEPTDEKAHLLLRSVDTTLIMGEEEPVPLDLATDEDRLRELPAPIVLHPDEEISSQRLLEALVRVNRVSQPPRLGLD